MRAGRVNVVEMVDGDDRLASQADDGGIAGDVDVGQMLREVVDRTSLRVHLRDGRGRFAAFNASVPQLLPVSRSSALGHESWTGVQYLDRDGHELAMLDHPAQAARQTGIPRTGEVLGLRWGDGEEQWFTGDFIPVDGPPGECRVLGVLMDVTEIQRARIDAEQGARAAWLALDVAHALGGPPRHPRAVADALREPLSALLPASHIGFSVHRDDSSGWVPMFTIADRPGMLPFPDSVRVTPLIRERRREGVHVNNNVQVTDIYGGRAVGGDAHPARSACVLLLTVEDDSRGTLVVFNQRPGFFTPARVQALSRIAPLVAAAIDVRALAPAQQPAA